MAYTVIYDDIVFVEGDLPNSIRGSSVECDLSFKFGAQLKSLRDVKNDLVKKAKASGYNAILDFTYGQKSRWLAIDDVAFWGKGCMANIPQEIYNEIKNAAKT